jgi:hypothetical protein
MIIIRRTVRGKATTRSSHCGAVSKTLFYLDGMTFKLNWSTGESTLIEFYHRPKDGESELIPTTIVNARNPPFQESGTHTPFANGENPDLPIYVAGRRYFTSAYDSNPTTGTPGVREQLRCRLPRLVWRTLGNCSSTQHSNPIFQYLRFVRAIQVSRPICHDSPSLGRI